MTWTLRLATPDDGAAIADIYRPIVETSPASFEVTPPDADDMARRIQDTVRTHPWLVLEGTSGIVAYAYGTRHRERPSYQWSVETSVYVHAAFRRRGIGRALYTVLIPTLRAQGFANAYAGIALPNAGSVCLHEALGFRLVGVYRHVGYKLGAWHDVGWWHRPLTDPPGTPAPPKRPDEVPRDSSWSTWLAAGLSCIREDDRRDPSL